MSGVCGRYKRHFREATHVVFDGHLDDPSFRDIAMQRIVAISDDTVTLARSGELPINRSRMKRGEYVSIEFTCPLFGKQRTRGWPFHDDHAAYAATPR